MKENEQASLSIKKIALITLVLIFLLGVSVKATTDSLNTVTIVLYDNYQIEVITTKTVVSEILEENHIIVLPTESVLPSLDAEIGEENATITITSAMNPTELVTIADESENVTMEQLLSTYSTIVEKIETVTEKIAYNTVNSSGEVVDTTDTSKNYKTITEGVVGEKELQYKVKYQNDIEIERELISETIVTEVVDKVVKEVTTVSNNSTSYSISYTASSTTSLADSVAGIEPIKVTLNASAYTASTCGKSSSSPSYGVTSSGTKATAWYTVAAGSAYPIGTVIYIPYFSNQSNGGWFVVQDRGSAITNNKIDIYMSTYSECVSFGRRNLECYVYVQ